MAGFSLILLCFWPLFLLGGLLYLVGMALSAIAKVLLAWNGLLFLFLVWVYRIPKIRALRAPEFVNTQRGARRWILLLLRYGLPAWMVWELLLVAGCGAYLLWGLDLWVLLLRGITGA